MAGQADPTGSTLALTVMAGEPRGLGKPRILTATTRSARTDEVQSNGHSEKVRIISHCGSVESNCTSDGCGIASLACSNSFVCHSRSCRGCGDLAWRFQSLRVFSCRGMRARSSSKRNSVDYSSGTNRDRADEIDRHAVRRDRKTVMRCGNVDWTDWIMGTVRQRVVFRLWCILE